MRPILALNCLLQIEQEKSEEESSVGDAVNIHLYSDFTAVYGLPNSTNGSNQLNRPINKQVKLPDKVFLGGKSSPYIPCKLVYISAHVACNELNSAFLYFFFQFDFRR